MVEERPCVSRRNDAKINTSFSIIVNVALIANQFLLSAPPPFLTIEAKPILKLQTLSVEVIVINKPRTSPTCGNEIMRKGLMLKDV